ncbi:phytanoyl-CoA dioxygenase family protein [Enhygromyxa salina]|uniref:phytanoyl-CoA dioxygenase family protein n=1 Tax=Enhygromyxa salina TaxID=215803 RepID=UPI000695E3DC|nr:phytanoyl-CoA dioxygenase family protein [Enhygromyxa salina]
MAEELYLRLFAELNDSRFDSPEAQSLLDQLGSRALAFRAFARARRRAWGRARADFLAALELHDTHDQDDQDDQQQPDPLLLWICGAGLIAVRDYDRGVATLTRAAANAGPNDEVGVATRARKLALKYTTLLGWSHEARELRESIATLDIHGAKHLRAHGLELQRQAAIRRRAQQALEGPPDLSARKAYALLFRDGPDAAGEALDTLLRRHGDHPALLRARLRLELLLDQLESAEQRAAALSDANAAALRAERAALALAWGDANQALLLTREAGDDPQLLYLRGLATRLLVDDPGEAAELFERARVALPNSVAINLALAVTRHLQDPHEFTAGIERRFEELLEWAPGLLADAAASAGLSLWTDDGPAAEREIKAQILQRAHGMLTSERDVSLSTYARKGSNGRLHLRHVAPVGEGPSHCAKLHHDEDELISQYEATLVWAIGVRPPRPDQADARRTEHEAQRRDDSDPSQLWTPRYLSAAQIEQFLRDGFIVLPGAFDPELARRWREDAKRRLRDEPERWVRGYDPSDESRSLAGFSADDPSTWNRSRIDLLGPETLVIEEFSPTAWAAICDLLGGPARIETTSWGNYLILNLRDDDPDAKDQPSGHATSWHIDDPSPTTRVDRIRNGLVCIALFDKLLPRSGNTWLALDSVARVARELAANPSGVDFVTDRGSRITKLCERFHEVVGEAGDILLLHPLLMHSASQNRSGRIRWMANPMVYMKQPLDITRPVEQLSPVELAIHRAIQTP